MEFYIACAVENCVRHGTEACRRCANNKRRNKPIDGFKDCKDADFSKLRARNGRYKTKQVGAPEHGGLQCPACRYLNNCYTFDEESRYECEECGLPLTLDDY